METIEKEKNDVHCYGLMNDLFYVNYTRNSWFCKVLLTFPRGSLDPLVSVDGAYKTSICMQLKHCLKGLL